jgi:hypothetical protein
MRYLILAGLLAAVPQSAEQYREVVKQQLTYIQGALADEGYQRTHDYAYGELNSNAEETVSFELDEGVSYAATAVCDQDCTDVDLFLLDENGNVVAEDQDEGDEGDFAVVEVTPAWTGAFTLRVRMYACSVEPCHYGIAIFGR